MLNSLSRWISVNVANFSEGVSSFWQNFNISEYSAFQVFLDIILVAVLFYWLIMMIRGSRATNVMIGLFGLVLVFVISRWFQLLALNWVLDRLLTVILVAIPIIFQQELRRGLEKLGRTKFFLAQEAKEMDIIRSQIIQACFEMSKKKMGALIVFRGEVSLKEYIDTGVIMYARISKELLISIFQPASPLHDGAVIIDLNRIVAAGCILPHSFKEYESTNQHGTRHKAAMALSEATDAKIFVISEQRGTVSYVSEGQMEEDILEERAQEIITSILEKPSSNFLKKRNKEAKHV